MKNIITIVILVLLTLETPTWCQITVPFTSDRWKFETKDYVIEDYMGKQSVLLKKSHATLPDIVLENGIIEYDVAFPQARAFIGVTFRMKDDINHEEFYIRPHQSGNPDANQYTPVFGGVSAWQLYYGEGYGTPVKYAYDTWIHVKLLISGNYMEVYLNDMNSPIIFSELKGPAKKGYLGIGNFLNENHFANFTYTATDKVQLKGTPKPVAAAANGTVTKWQVSTSFPESKVEKTMSFNPSEKNNLKWTAALTENTGTLNLATVATFAPKTNSVFVSVLVTSDEAQIKKLTFGFSDKVRVYLNDNLLFFGEDSFTSRDYRFLGTIGYYDAVYLNLKKGQNEIILAVSENFGGWGVKAKFEDMSGIRILD